MQPSFAVARMIFAILKISRLTSRSATLTIHLAGVEKESMLGIIEDLQDEDLELLHFGVVNNYWLTRWGR